MFKKIIFSIFVIACSKIHAQQKLVSYKDAFANGANVFQNLPNFISWIDDNTVLITEKTQSNSKPIHYAVNILNGNKTIYEQIAKETEEPLKLPVDAVNPTKSPNNQLVAFTKNNNLFVQNIANEKVTQITNSGSSTLLNGYASWVYFEEILGRQSKYKAFWWSNDSKQIAFMQFDDSEVPVYPIYVAKGQHGYTENTRYPKVGDKNPKVKIGIADISTGNIVWANFNTNDDQYFGMPYFTPNNDLWIQWMNRDQNQLIIYQIDKSTGDKKEIYKEEQSTWIDLDDTDRIEFLPNGKQFILKSDKSGWYQYYLHDISGKLINPITQGNYTVGSIIKVEKDKLYFTARKEHSARWDFYSVNLNSKNLTRHSFGDFSFLNIQLSPKQNYYVASFGNLKTPTTIAVIDLNGTVKQILGSIKGNEFSNYVLPKKEMIRVKSTDGLFDLPVVITYPNNFNPNKKYPVLMNVYGGPNSGRVYDVWNTTLIDAWWAQEDLIQISADNRSSGHFGKLGMNYIYRQLGIYEIEDFMAIGKWIKQQTWSDTAKLCITGGSFGGYMTCMALTYGANVFNYGVANASVTDWKLYDTHYTERFMDTPEQNPEGYKKTSVMEYAKNYKGLLRIVHGTSDDNVHQQNSTQFIDVLQNLKKHFEFMLYPGERHSIGGLKGLHNRTEAYKFYYNNLLEKPMPKDFWE